MSGLVDPTVASISMFIIGIVLLCVILVNAYKILKSEVRVNWTAAMNATNFDKWLPQQALRDEILYRGNPDYVDTNSGGMAIWERSSLEARGSPLHRVIIRDHFNPRNWPYVHDAFVHYYFVLSDERTERYLKYINNRIPTVNLEPTQKLLHVEGTFSAQNQIVLSTVIDLIDAEKPVTEADVEELRQILIKRIHSRRFDPHETYACESAIK